MLVLQSNKNKYLIWFVLELVDMQLTVLNIYRFCTSFVKSLDWFCYQFLGQKWITLISHIRNEHKCKVFCELYPAVFFLRRFNFDGIVISCLLYLYAHALLQSCDITLTYINKCHFQTNIGRNK